MSCEWIKEFSGGVTVCDKDGVIREMNDKAARIFEKEGGRALLGRNLFDCHPEPARTKLKDLMAARSTNAYTIEKDGVKKLIYQSPWHAGGEYRGFVELALEIPPEMAHFVRK